MYQNQTQNPTDQGLNFFWLLALIIIGVMALWFFGRHWVITPVFWLRIHEIELIKFALAVFNDIISWSHVVTPSTVEMDKVLAYMKSMPADRVSFQNFAAINAYVTDLLVYPYMAILLLLSVIIYFRHGTIRFRQTYSMNSLKKLEVENWPQITPVVNIDLVKQDLDEGEWAMAKTPLNFCKEHNLAKLTVIDDRKVWTIDTGPATRLFAMQLGPLWQGADALPIHIKALIVIFVARAERDRDVAHRVLKQIAASAASGKLDFTGVNELFQKYGRSKIIRWLETKHAYVNTLMSTLLEIARTDGVIATAEFLWLKPVDRRLWYVLNSVGRQTAVVEVSGVFAHWLAEKRLQRPLKSPMVKRAVMALKMSLEDTLYVAPEDRWHTSNVD